MAALRHTPHVRCILFNKPFRVLTRFSAETHQGEARATLRDYISQRGIYPAGRLDYDSEGLLLLTDDGATQARVSDPRFHLPKTYWAQVEGTATPAAIAQLLHGVRLNDGEARALSARITDEPAGVWPRDPPIRYRASIPTAWLEIVIDEGRNRQVRRMTAAVGLPTLRLIRAGIGPWRVEGLAPGGSRELPAEEVYRVLRARVGAGRRASPHSTPARRKRPGRSRA